MATIEHRGPGSWRIGIRTSSEEGRKWIRRTLNFPESMPLSEQRKRAELEAAKLTVAAAEGRAVPASAITVRDFAQIWLKQYVEPQCRPTTYRNYKFFLDSRILPALGDIRLQRLNVMQCVSFFNDLGSADKLSSALPPQQRKRIADRAVPPRQLGKLSPKTIRHYYQCLDAMLGKAVQWEYLDRNPLDKVNPPKVRKPRVKSLDDAQAVELLRCLALDDRMSFRCAVLLALLCGLRLSEVGALRLEDVDWEHGTINVSRALNYTPALGNYIDGTKSEAGERVVTLPAGMMALLYETRKYHQEMAQLLGDRWRGEGRIVCNWDGTPMHHDTPSKQFRKFADAHGFEGVRFHDLRHTHASILLANNIDAVAVASRIGHSDASTTLRVYAHAFRRRDVESGLIMQDLIERAYGTEAPPTPADMRIDLGELFTDHD